MQLAFRRDPQIPVRIGIHTGDIISSKEDIIGDGVNAFDPVKEIIYPYQHSADDTNSLSSNRVDCSAIDHNNNLWFGTQNGLSYFDKSKQRFNHFYCDPLNPLSLSNNSVICIEVGKNGDVWAGTKGGGVNRFRRNKDSYDIERIDTKNSDLSNDFVLSIKDDGKGFLWIGTENGGLNKLNIVTGEIEVYQKEEGNQSSINSNSVWTVYYDPEGKLWIGTANSGINVIDPNFNKFESYQKILLREVTLTDNDIKGFAEDSYGNVWIATDGGGICKFDTKKKEIVLSVQNHGDNRSITKNEVIDILCDSEDNIWAACWAGGIDLFNLEGRRLKNYRLENHEGIANINVFRLHQDSKGNIWAGSGGGGLFLYDTVEDKFNQIRLSQPSEVITTTAYISSFLEDSEGYLWIGTYFGRSRLNIVENQGEFECEDYLWAPRSSYISSKAIEILYEDRKGRIWIGTGDNGLNLIVGDTSIVFQKKDGLPSNFIRGILEDNEGNLWISTNNGLSKFNADSLLFTNFTVEDGLNSNEFYARACLRTRSGEIFLGGENGFNVFYPQNIKNNDFIPPVYLSNLIVNNVHVGIGDQDSPLPKNITEVKRIELNYKQSSFTLEFVALNYTRPTRNQFMYKLVGFDDEWINAGTRRSASYTNIKPGTYEFLIKGANNDGVWNEIPTAITIRVNPPLWGTWWAIIIYVLLITTITTIVFREWNGRVRMRNQLKVEQLAREKEHELNEANIRYFTNISHEFRTPLSLIIAPLDSLIQSAKDDMKDQLGMINRNAGRLLQLTNTLMDIRKLETGNTRIRAQKNDVVALVNQVISYFKINEPKEKHEIIFETEEDEIIGWFDSEKLETILINLVSNAIKYSKERSNIKVVLNLTKQHIEKGMLSDHEISESIGNFIEVRVIDKGVGIPKEELPMIFNKFYRTKSNGKTRNQGTGVGLALVKGLVELMHGQIQVTSNLNRGTCFTFVLPVDKEVFQPEELIVDPYNTIIEQTNIKTGIDITDEIAIPNEDGAFQESEILVVEDNEDLREFIVRELGKNYPVHAAENGKIGIEKALAKLPDLIISDILMPELDGTELCKTIKSDIRTSHIPVILLTAKTAIEEQIEGLQTGADLYITKPFNIQLLKAQIQQLINSHKKLYAHFSQEVYIMPQKITENGIDQQFIEKTMDYITDNITDSNLSVEGLADTMHLSRSNVYRKIKALTGKTVVEFIRMVRLKQAIKHMETKKYSLAEIAYLTGFTSPSYFTKTFKEQYGKPPSEYLTP